MPPNLPDPSGSQEPTEPDAGPGVAATDTASPETVVAHTETSEPGAPEPVAAEPVAAEPVAADEPAPVLEQPDAPVPPAPAAPAADPADKAAVRRLVVLGVAAVLLVAGAVVLGMANHAARANGPLANQAFVDTGATSAVVGDVTSAIKTVYSYDYRTLDANQAAAKAVITGKYAQDFDKLFGALKQLAPQQQAVLTTTVPAVGVLQVQNDRARLLMMVDQNGTRMGSQPIAGTSARLIVAAQRVDGHWKIAEVTPE